MKIKREKMGLMEKAKWVKDGMKEEREREEPKECVKEEAKEEMKEGIRGFESPYALILLFRTCNLLGLDFNFVVLTLLIFFSSPQLMSFILEANNYF